jgi:hypothetical protein
VQPAAIKQQIYDSSFHLAANPIPHDDTSKNKLRPALPTLETVWHSGRITHNTWATRRTIGMA